jgi:hypothetical protein
VLVQTVLLVLLTQTVKVVAVVLAEAMVLSLTLEQLLSTPAEFLTPQVTLVVELVLLTLRITKFPLVAAEL